MRGVAGGYYVHSQAVGNDIVVHYKYTFFTDCGAFRNRFPGAVCEGFHNEFFNALSFADVLRQHGVDF